MKSKKEKKVTVEKKVSKVRVSAAKAATTKPLAKKARVEGTKTRKPAKSKPSKDVENKKDAKVKVESKAKAESKVKAEKKEKPKKFFPEKAAVNILPTGAVPPKVPTTKRSAWTKKPIENPHSTPAGPCVNLRDIFDSYVAKKYKRLKDEQRKAVWQEVAMRMLSEPSSRLTEITDEILSKK